MRSQIILRFASIYGFVGVSLGAFGAHALKDRLAASNMSNAWQTAVLYTLIHTVALLALSGVVETPSLAEARRGLGIVAIFWIGGVMLFSGSLFWWALGGPRWLGPITPLGGLAFLAGWFVLMLQAFKTRRAL